MADVYGYSFSEETYEGRYNTREEALAAAKAMDSLNESWARVGCCWTCRGVDVQPVEYLPDAAELIERVEEGISDNHGNEDSIFNADKAQRDDLDCRMRAAFNEWMSAHPTAWRRYYEAEDVEEHTWPVEEGIPADAVDPHGEGTPVGPSAREK